MKDQKNTKPFNGPREGFKLKGELSIRIIDKNGNLKEERTIKNLIVNLGYDSALKRLSEVATDLFINNIAFGTGSTPPTLSDTGLTGTFMKPVDGHSFPTTDKVDFDWSLDYLENNGVTIAEYALFCNDGTTMFSRVIDTPVPKDNTIRLEGFWRIFL